MVLLDHSPSSSSPPPPAPHGDTKSSTHFVLDATSSESLPVPPRKPVGMSEGKHELQRFEAAANVMAKHVKGWYARFVYGKQKAAAQVLENAMRGMQPRRNLMDKRRAARTIQINVRRSIAGGEGPSARANIALVKKFITALEENDTSSIRSLASTNFVYDRQIKGHIVQTNSLNAFLDHPIGKAKMPPAAAVYEPLRMMGLALEPTGTEQRRERTVVREVCYALTDVREEFTVRRSKSGAAAKVCRHALYFHSQSRGAAQHTPSHGGADAVGEVQGGCASAERASWPTHKPSGRSQLAQLREAFSTLDVNGDGSIMIDELKAAFRLVGLDMKDEEVISQLNGVPVDVKGMVQLTDLDVILRQDHILQESGIEYSRPLILDVLPLVSRTFDAHQVVDDALRIASERDRSIFKEHRVAMRRLQGKKQHLKALVKSPTMHLAAFLSTSKPKGAPASEGGARRLPALPPGAASWGKPITVAEEPSGAVNYKELSAEVAEAGPRGPGIHISGVPGLAPVRYANAAGRKARTGLGASSGAGAYNGCKRGAMATSSSLPALGRRGGQVARSRADREANDQRAPFASRDTLPQRGEATRLPQLKPSKSHAGLVRSRPPPGPPSSTISP